MSHNVTRETGDQEKSAMGDAREAVRETFSGAADTAASTMREAGQYYVAEPAGDLFSLLRDYAKDKPDVAAMWAFGLGVVVGWKLRG
tara:strand:+ start:77510 stop:77770 length:261 start_codon:yes stop_codon:yes gene_type:complete